jgi:hypothetical protein
MTWVEAGLQRDQRYQRSCTARVALHHAGLEVRVRRIAAAHRHSRGVGGGVPFVPGQPRDRPLVLLGELESAYTAVHRDCLRWAEYAFWHPYTRVALSNVFQVQRARSFRLGAIAAHATEGPLVVHTSVVTYSANMRAAVIDHWQWQWSDLEAQTLGVRPRFRLPRGSRARLMREALAELRMPVPHASPKDFSVYYIPWLRNTKWAGPCSPHVPWPFPPFELGIRRRHALSVTKRNLTRPHALYFVSPPPPAPSRLAHRQDQQPSVPALPFSSGGGPGGPGGSGGVSTLPQLPSPSGGSGTLPYSASSWSGRGFCYARSWLQWGWQVIWPD